MNASRIAQPVALAAVVFAAIGCAAQGKPSDVEVTKLIGTAAKGVHSSTSDPKNPTFIADHKLDEMGVDAVPALIKGLSSPDADVRQYCVGFFVNVQFRRKDDVPGKLKKDAMPALDSIAMHDTGTSAVNSLRLLTILNDPASAKTYEAVLSDAKNPNRGIASLGLAKLADPSTLDFQLALLSGSDREVASNSITGVAMIGGPKATDALEKAYDGFSKRAAAETDRAKARALMGATSMLKQYIDYDMAGGTKSGKPFPHPPGSAGAPGTPRPQS